jgi:hypothetical protein
VRQTDQLAELGVDVFVHADPAKGEIHAVLVENTHDHAFAVEHGDDRETNIDLAPLHLELDAAVLGNALLGNIQPGHDLQAADDRRLEAIDLRGHGLFLQYTVDPVADLHALFLGLDVNVARPGLNRFAQDLVHQPDDGCFLSHLRGFGMVPLQVVENFDPSLSFFALCQQPVDGLGTHTEM